MKLYVAGPMAGYPEFNHPLFNDVSEELREQGHEVVNPAELDETEPLFEHKDGRVTPTQRAAYLRRDFRLLVDCDGIVLLPKYWTSTGATCELAVARILALDVYEWDAENRWLQASSAVPDTVLIDRHIWDVMGDQARGLLA